MLHLKRTGAYLKYVATFWDTVFDTPLRDIDQFRMYLADKTRCTLSKREQAYAERCRGGGYGLCCNAAVHAKRRICKTGKAEDLKK